MKMKKSTYTKANVMAALKQKKGVGMMVGSVIAVVRGALGTYLLGGLNFLTKTEGVRVKFMDREVYEDLVRGKTITPFFAKTAKEA